MAAPAEPLRSNLACRPQAVGDELVHFSLQMLELDRHGARRVQTVLEGRCVVLDESAPGIPLIVRFPGGGGCR